VATPEEEALEREGSHETPLTPPGAPEPTQDEMDAADEASDRPPSPADEPEPAAEPPAALPQAEPGVYRCVAEISGEHALLGVLTQGQEYDYRVSDPRVLQAVAAYVERGV
jgi:hypothetical protein